VGGLPCSEAVDEGRWVEGEVFECVVLRFCSLSPSLADIPLRLTAALILLLSTLFLLPLSRPQNTPLFLLFYILHLTLHRLAHRGLLSPLGVAPSVVTWQALGFFALGGSNALARCVFLSSSLSRKAGEKG
jgi:hypothetical protein